MTKPAARTPLTQTPAFLELVEAIDPSVSPKRLVEIIYDFRNVVFAETLRLVSDSKVIEYGIAVRNDEASDETVLDPTSDRSRIEPQVSDYAERFASARLVQRVVRYGTWTAPCP